MRSNKNIIIDFIDSYDDLCLSRKRKPYSSSNNTPQDFFIHKAIKRVISYRNIFAGYEHLAATIIPRYVEHMKNIEKFIAFRNRTPQFFDSEAYNHHVNAINDFIRDFIDSKEALLTAIENEQRNFRRSWIQCIISLLGGVVLGGLVTYFFFT